MLYAYKRNLFVYMGFCSGGGRDSKDIFTISYFHFPVKCLFLSVGSKEL